MINRLKEDLIGTSAMGRVSNRPVASYGQLDPKMGVSRPEGSSANKVLRDFTVQCMQTAGLSVRIDRVGNIFGRKDGSMNHEKSVMVGSHLDSVMNGGHLSVYPNNMNVIPGMVELGFDIRNTSLVSMQRLTDETLSFLNGLKQEKGMHVHMESPDTQEPVKLSDDIVRTIEKAVVKTGIRFKRMASGAGHDTQNMASITRTGMIFVPSVKGISHSPMEWTEWDDIEKGVSVLTGALKYLSVCNELI